MNAIRMLHGCFLVGVLLHEAIESLAANFRTLLWKGCTVTSYTVTQENFINLRGIWASVHEEVFLVVIFFVVDFFPFVLLVIRPCTMTIASSTCYISITSWYSILSRTFFDYLYYYCMHFSSFPNNLFSNAILSFE